MNRPMMLAALAFAAIPCVAWAESPREPNDAMQLVMQAEAGTAIPVDRDWLASAVTLAVRAGIRRGRFSGLLSAELDGWRGPEVRGEPTDLVATLNVGVGGQFEIFPGIARSALFFGPCVLIEETSVDDKGSTGVFLDVRPAGLHLDLGDARIGFDPIGVKVVAPVLGSIPLVVVQYMASVYGEFSL